VATEELHFARRLVAGCHRRGQGGDGARIEVFAAFKIKAPAPVIPQLGDAAMGSRLWRGRLALSIKARAVGAEIFVIVPPLMTTADFVAWRLPAYPDAYSTSLGDWSTEW
jgi:hypothetical protein